MIKFPPKIINSMYIGIVYCRQKPIEKFHDTIDFHNQIHTFLYAKLIYGKQLSPSRSRCLITIFLNSNSMMNANHFRSFNFHHFGILFFKHLVGVLFSVHCNLFHFGQGFIVANVPWAFCQYVMASEKYRFQDLVSVIFNFYCIFFIFFSLLH